ncbi:MAG: site-specific integrase [Oscillospiraceae bacterium]|nr:site-specific integrase [Oscillospiraceae bacterium]
MGGVVTVPPLTVAGVVHEEAASVAPKTVENLWRLITGTMRSLKITPPEINLPAVPGVDTAWLNYKQVMVFVDAVRNKPCELYALLALHSLRLSEIMALTPARVDFEKEQIKVAGARVMGEEGVVEKKTNKTRKSRRPVPIMIPRLLEILPREGDDYLVKSKPNNLHLRINTVCRQAGLPEVGVQGLRRSFASLAYHLGWNERTTMEIGGWTNPATVHRFYIKLAEEDINKRAEAMKNFYSQGSKITTEITTKA